MYMCMNSVSWTQVVQLADDLTHRYIIWLLAAETLNF